MSVQLSKVKHYLFLLAIILTNIVLMADYVVMPVANNLYEIFPESVAGVNFILSGPAIFCFFGSLIAPRLFEKIHKKVLLSISCAVCAVTAIFGASVVSVGYIIACRSIGGLFGGFIQVIVLDIIADYYVDDNKRASFLGIYNAAMAGIGAVMGMVAGNLAVTGWQNAYLTYWAAVPMVLLVIFCVPKLKSANAIGEEEQASGKAEPLGARYWIMLINNCILNICYTPMLYMASVYIAENGLGNEAVSGLAASLGTVGSCLCCLAFGFLFSKLKARTSLISYAVMAVGLIGMFLLPNQFAFLAICTVCGGAYGMLFSYIYAVGPSIVSPQNISKAISYLAAGGGLAMFAGTYVTSAVVDLVPQHTVGAASLVLGIVCAVCFVVEFINTGKMKESV